MKKRNKSKLGLDKLRITKLHKPNYIVGGTPPTIPDSPTRTGGSEKRTAGEDRYKSEGDCP